MDGQPTPVVVGLPAASTSAPAADAGSTTAREGEALLVQQLREGDESAFTSLVARFGGAMLRFARMYTDDAAVAEDAVQDAWLAVLRGIDRFEARASLRTWIFRILLNRLRTQLKRERRFLPFSDLSGPAEPAVDPDRFLEADHPRWPHHWEVPPQSWGESPEERLLSLEARALVARAIGALPTAQREVITLRDVEGWSAQEVCALLEITESNQRVLLHRARSRVRRALEDYLAPQ